MAQPRTFQFYGLAYGSSPVSIVASINSTQVFSGPVTTVDQPWTGWSPPPAESQVVLFTIDNSTALNTDFSGSLPMTVSVTGGSGLFFGQINSNYNTGSTPAGMPDGWNQCYQGTPSNSENSQDPRSSVSINGVGQTPVRPPNGTWCWAVPSEQNIAHNWNIGLGAVANALGNAQSYTGDYTSFVVVPSPPPPV